MSLASRTAALLALGAALVGQTTLECAQSQSPSPAAARPQPSKDLPPDFIDSRPILAYIDDKPVPDTVRGLLEELKRPDRCGKDAKVDPDEACALVIYKLDDTFTPDRLRPPLIMRAIYRISVPDDPANTVMMMPDNKGDLQRYVGGDLYEPLRNIRANVCLQDKRTPDRCKSTDSKGVLYRPYGFLGKIENDRENILPAKSAAKHFLLNLKPADEEWIKAEEMRDLCHILIPGTPLC